MLGTILLINFKFLADKVPVFLALYHIHSVNQMNLS